MRAIWTTLAALTAVLPATVSLADEANATAENPTLEQRLEQAEQRIRVLERRLELADETATAATKSTPVVKAAPAGVSIAAADSSTVIKLRGNLAVDGRFFFDQNTPER